MIKVNCANNRFQECFINKDSIDCLAINEVGQFLVYLNGRKTPLEITEDSYLKLIDADRF